MERVVGCSWNRRSDAVEYACGRSGSATGSRVSWPCRGVSPIRGTCWVCRRSPCPAAPTGQACPSVCNSRVRFLGKRRFSARRLLPSVHSEDRCREWSHPPDGAEQLSRSKQAREPADRRAAMPRTSHSFEGPPCPRQADIRAWRSEPPLSALPARSVRPARIRRVPCTFRAGADRRAASMNGAATQRMRSWLARATASAMVRAPRRCLAACSLALRAPSEIPSSHAARA